MKSIFLSILMIIAVTTFTSFDKTRKTIPASASPNASAEICFKIKNDSGESVTFHTGKGTVPINNGILKEFCMEDGAKLYLADKGKKGKLLIEVSSEVAGKKFNLSDL